MNRRADNRIEMTLACHLLFPRIWQVSASGFTANLHRNGALVACNLSTHGLELPVVGEKAILSIVLPLNHYFRQKCIDCESQLIRMRQVSPGQWLFALRFENVNFAELAEEEPAGGADIDKDAGGYIV